MKANKSTDKLNKIGIRIKELRIKKKLTQKELAGERITRNMLSLIESGAACPSVDTIIYLSEKLEIPVGYFFTDSPEEEKNYYKSTIIDSLKRNFSAKNYTNCMDICSSIPVSYIDDEIGMIAAVAYLDAAINCAKKYSLNEANANLSKAVEFSNRTIYLSSSFHMAAEYYFKLFQYLNSTEIPSIITDLKYASEYIPYEMIIYFGIIKYIKNQDKRIVPLFEGTVYGNHIEAISLLNEGKETRALKILKDLSQDADLPYFMKYRVLCDLETAANQAGDLRVAYVSARKKLELINPAGSKN